MAGARPQQEEIARTPPAPIDPKRDQDKPAFLTDRIELLRERRGDEEVTFGDICDHMHDYLGQNPDDDKAVRRLALFLAKVEDVPHEHD